MIVSVTSVAALVDATYAASPAACTRGALRPSQPASTMRARWKSGLLDPCWRTASSAWRSRSPVTKQQPAQPCSTRAAKGKRRLGLIRAPMRRPGVLSPRPEHQPNIKFNPIRGRSHLDPSILGRGCSKRSHDDFVSHPRVAHSARLREFFSPLERPSSVAVPSRKNASKCEGRSRMGFEDWEGGGQSWVLILASFSWPTHRKRLNLAEPWPAPPWSPPHRFSWSSRNCCCRLEKKDMIAHTTTSGASECVCIVGSYMAARRRSAAPDQECW